DDARAVSNHSETCADRHSAVALRIPRDSNSRVKLFPHRTIDVLSAGVLRVAGKNEPRRGLREYLAMEVLCEQIQIEMLILAAVVVRRQIRFPSHAVIQRDA